MKNKIKKMLVILMVLVAISPLFAQGSSEKEKSNSDEQTTLTFWSWLPTTIQWDDMVEAFEKENPEIKINYTRTEQSDYFEKLQVAMASGTGPDIFGLSTGALVNRYATFAEPMDTLADQYIPGWKDIISSSAVSECISNNNIQVGMPMLVAGMDYMLYNQTLMNECGIDEVPTTNEEMVDAANKIRAKGYMPVAMGAADDWQNVDWFVNVSNQFEPNAVYQAQEGKRSFTDQCFIDTANAWASLFTNGVFQDGALGVVTYPDARDQYFFDRKSVFFATGSWHVGVTSVSNTELEGTAIKENNDVIGMTAFPQMGPNEFRATTGVDLMLGVNKDCENKEAAAKFIEFMSMGAGQQIWVDLLQGSPVANTIVYNGKVDGQLQQQSIDELNNYNSNAIGSRKLKYPELEKAIVVAMQNIAAGADAKSELEVVEKVSKSIER
ncbi:MAG: extracellular solute-binding protein [Sphaerochaetaceae bacterium]|nr:extracellular solute-binding protein [Sphaerochaetaceae bacterium]MDC7249125.1 extracellular solute-binding protein [Sphaerochaetaceae bacterium]